jgi:diamine N-acetyltransferase
MIIRQARKDEIKKLQDLNDKAFADNPNYDPDLDLNWAQSDEGKKYFTNAVNSSDNYFLVAEEKSTLVGYLAAAPKHFDFRKSNYIEIENLGIIPEYRSKGLGKKLIEKCLKWAKEKGYQKAYLRCYFKNTHALSFYKNNGFSEISVSLEKNI